MLKTVRIFDITVLKQRLEREILPHFSTRRQQNAQTLKQTLYQTPIITIKIVAELLGLQTNTAAMLVNDFVKYGVLHELTGKRRNRIFWFKDYVVIFKQQKEHGYQ